jgi:hypothetical protein
VRAVLALVVKHVEASASSRDTTRMVWSEGAARRCLQCACYIEGSVNAPNTHRSSVAATSQQ